MIRFYISFLAALLVVSSVLSQPVFAQAQLTMEVGEQTVRGVAGSISSVSSSDNNVASAAIRYGDGWQGVEITARSAGVAEIRATYPDQPALSINVTVVDRSEPGPGPEPDPEPEPDPRPEPGPGPGQEEEQDSSITLNPPELRLERVGDSGRIEAVVDAPSIQGPIIIWSSEDAEIAEVSAEGIVTARGTGETTITATLQQDPATSASARVTVGEVRIKAVRFYPPAVCMATSSSVRIEYSVEPRNATEELRWLSLNDSLATVTPNRDDSITVTSSGDAHDVNIIAYVIRVSDNPFDSGALVPSDHLGVLQVAIMPPPARIELHISSAGAHLAAPNQDYRSRGFFMKPGESAWLEGIIFPNDAFGKEVTWSASNDSAITFGRSEPADLYVDTSRPAARACLAAQTGSFSPAGGRYYPRVYITANQVPIITSTVVRATTNNGLQAELTIHVMPDDEDDYSEFWDALSELSDQKEFERFILNRRLNRLPPFVQNFVNSDEFQVLWKIKDKHPKAWIFNIMVILGSGDSWSNSRIPLVKEIIGKLAGDNEGLKRSTNYIIDMFSDQPPEIDVLGELLNLL